ncbi:hypothetical protein B0H63DRAFT_525661 [Podospora didyma]|uniref:Mitochondrial LSU ribosomal protein L34 n=1 Tax=Podospora didyma TaxID=330526 RepID=A0AAE0KKH8_9PEZI|nr:hypothetical protein B0H63DRAFT_525661 [Podospora didyma]
MSRLAISSSPLLQAALQPSRSQLLQRCLAKPKMKTTQITRSFSHLPSLRPTTLSSSSSSSSSSIFRQTQTPLARLPATATNSMSAEGEVLDLVPKSSISAHPAFGGIASQIRCGPRPTMSGHSRLVQKRRHGFLSRIKTKNGRKTLQRRKEKGRKRLSA